MNNIESTTVTPGFCSGCGVCQVSCPVHAITINYTELKEYKPQINIDVCTNCGRCTNVCPNSIYQKNKLINFISVNKDPVAIGIDNGIAYYRCKDRNKDSILKSASGGFVTAFASELLRKNIIDCVIHGEQVCSKTGEEHYRACISRSVDELDSRRSSIYGPVSFANVLNEFANKSCKVLAIGVPCAITGIINIFRENKFKNNKLFTISLTCSHNVSGQFVDFLADYYGIPSEQEYYVNLRGKNENMKDRHSFHLNFRSKDGQIILDKDRTIFNPLWRNYYFAFDACSFCGDLYGYKADVSCKDCWGIEGNKDRFGSSLVIFRNELLYKIFYNMHSLEKECFSYDSARISEYPAAIYKQVKILNRLTTNNSVLLNNYLKTSQVSKNDYYLNGFQNIKYSIDKKLVEENRCNNYFSFFYKILKKNAKHFHIKYIYHLLRPYLITLRNIIHYEKKIYNKVIMVGGFDGKNAGDEAQIDSTVKIMVERYPHKLIKVLSHVPLYTWRHHYNVTVGPSPRMYIWDMDVDPSLYCSSLRNIFDRIRFLSIGYWTCLNAYLVRAGLPVFLISAKKATFLQDVKTSDLFYISGGGTMTGDTLSRCWDNVFCMKIANIMKVPFVLSGQNCGNWDSKFTEKFVANVLKRAKALTLRDVYSIENLKKMGVKGDNIFTMFDDALFCEKTNVDDLLKWLAVDNDYIVLNIHYWGCENNIDAQKTLLNKIGNICDYIHKKISSQILLLPMSNTDVQPIEDFLGIYKKDYVRVARFIDYDFRVIRGIISKAKLCVTMKHHPIIFAIGECVPTISIAYKSYYTYKNAGALGIFNLEKYSIDIEKESFYDSFKSLFDDIVTNGDKIRNSIKEMIPTIKERRENFFKVVDVILKDDYK